MQYTTNFGFHKPYFLDSALVTFIGEEVLEDVVGRSVTIGTEINILDGILFRAHPSYRSHRSWHDFCYYQTSQMVYKRIAKLWCFVEVPKWDKQGYSAGIYAIATRSTRPVQEQTVLLNTAQMECSACGEWIYIMIKIEDILAPAYVVENIISKTIDSTNDDKSKVFVVKPRIEWIDEF